MVEPDTRLVSLMAGGCQCCGAALVGGAAPKGSKYCVLQRPKEIKKYTVRKHNRWQCKGYATKRPDSEVPEGDWRRTLNNEGEPNARYYYVDNQRVEPAPHKPRKYRGKYASAEEGIRARELYLEGRKHAAAQRKLLKEEEKEIAKIGREIGKMKNNPRRKIVISEEPEELEGFEGLGLVGGSRYSSRGSAANSNNSWQNFLRQYAMRHPELAHNRALLAKHASPEYQAMKASLM